MHSQQRAPGILLVVAAAALLTAGCGPSGRPTAYAVTGTVTYRGLPLADADVSFLPASGPMAGGRTDAHGRFQLTTFAPGDGAVAGEHSVLIVKKEKIVDPQTPSSPYEITRNVLPARYGLVGQSNLAATVTSSGPNDFTFPLTD